MSIRTPRIFKNRHGTYYFRYLLPKPLAQQLGQREYRQSLKTKDPALARLLGLRLNVQIEDMTQKKPPTRLEDLGPIRGLTPTSEAVSSKYPDLTRSSAMPEPLPTIKHPGLCEYRMDIAKGIYESSDEADHRRLLMALRYLMTQHKPSHA